MDSMNNIISAIILTYNEEKNIEDCLKSVSEIIDSIFIVDSGSTDNTLNICKKYTDKIYTNKFENYSQQRNWALDNLPIKTGWIMNLDADHRISDELKDELKQIFSAKIDDNIKGFLSSRRTIFMNRWIKHGGHYPVYHAFLFRKGFGYCENKVYDQHFVVDGNVKILKGDIIDIITDSLTTFTSRHNLWSDLETRESLQSGASQISDVITPSLTGHPIEKRRMYKKYYLNLPLFVRPMLYFIYRYFFRLGFLDGKEGLIFHFLQGFWFRFLIDAKIYENSSKDIK